MKNKGKKEGEGKVKPMLKGIYTQPQPILVL